MVSRETPPLALEIIKKEFKERTGKLVLSDCGLTEIPDEVFEMEWLTELVVSSERGIRVFQAFKKLINKVLKPINQFGEPNQLSEIPDRIIQLKELKKIKIGGSKNKTWTISDISILSYLHNLELIELSHNNISDISYIQKLQNLKSIELGYNNISDISCIQNLQKLEFIDFSHNSILDISFVQKLQKLQSLNFNSNNISDISFIQNLQNLQSLSLDSNNISDISFIRNLQNLQSLSLDSNNVSDISFIRNLKNLQFLNLSSNTILDISSIQNLKKIRTLHLASCGISNIDIFSELKNIETLWLSLNQIRNLKSLSKLEELSTLILYDNKIVEVKPLIHLQKLKFLALHNNNITDCPPDVWQSDDINQIRAYFEGKTRDKTIKEKETKKAAPKVKKKGGTPIPAIPEDPILEETVSEIEDVKLIFVGNSGSGKTQLSKYFETGKLDETRETTHGIRLNRWLPTGKVSPAFDILKSRVAANVWDFGGQEYYHGTFRLFLSNYAVYILLWEEETNKNEILSTTVRGNEKEDLQHYHYKYWLDNIRHYASNSPVLIVQNKIDKDKRQRTDTRWINDYDILGDHYISLHKAAENKKSKYKWSFDLFCNDLSSCFEQILEKEIQQKKSIAWLKIRDSVVEVAKSVKKSTKNPFFKHLKKGKYINIKDFENACKSIESALTTSEIYTMPRWLHNSGLVIYFGENEALNDKVYLDPIWVTEGVYKILNKTVRVADGVFSKKDMKIEGDFDADTLLALMQEMEIVFKKPDEADTYVAPQYLPETHPIEDLYDIAAKGLHQKAYFIRLPLYFFRKVLQRMIFFYGMSSNADARYYWKQGILFEKGDTRVIFKGIMPKAGKEEGTFLIGAEPVGAYRDIQKEVFHIIAAILEEKELAKFGVTDIVENMELSKMQQNIRSNTFSDIHHRPGNWTSRYETETPPRWLKSMEVSVDGENFANYLDLCHANRKESTFIQSNLGNRLRIHDFELLLDSKPQRPLKVFFSYSHKDTEIMKQLAVHLAPLKRLEKIETWSDKAILPGEEWDAAIKDNLQDADIVLFLISADFIASNYIWKKEIPLTMQLKNDPNGKVSSVIPIYLRPFDYSELPFTKLEMIPKGENEQLKAISQWENRDEAFMAVAKEIRAVIEQTV